MERVIIFKDTETGREMVMPVTPPEYRVEHGRKQNTITMAAVGDVTYPGAAVLIDEEPTFLLPVHPYPFNRPGAVLNPFVYLEQLEKWSDAGTVLRWVVAGTPVNAAVRLGPIRFWEDDGTNDVTCVVPIRGVRQLAAEEVEVTASAVPLESRPMEKASVKAGSYTVVKGDTLSAISLRFYGSAGLAARLGAYNGIKNVNLIRVGQVLSIPDMGQLPVASTGTGGRVTPTSSTVATVTVFFGGPSSYYGRVKVFYTAENGSATSAELSPTVASAALKVKMGSVLTILWQESAHAISYYTVGGVTRKGYKKLPHTVKRDCRIGVYWGV